MNEDTHNKLEMMIVLASIGLALIILISDFFLYSF